MPRQLIALLLLQCVAALPALAQDDDRTLPQLNNYAWGFPLETETDASFYRVQLPLIVNASVSDPRLRDSGVYNAAGQPVPRLIEQAVDDDTAVERRVALPLVPLYSNQVENPEELRLIFERIGERTRIDLRPDTHASGKLRPPLTAYIADARGIEDIVRAVEFSWQSGKSGFIGQATIEGSNDFARWQPLGRGALADLREGDAAITQSVVELDADGARYDYWRIRWSELPADWRLHELLAVHREAPPATDRQWLTLENAAPDADDNGWIFDLGAAARIDRLDMQLPESNTVVGADIYYRADAAARWVQVASTTFYRIRRGSSTVANPPVVITPVRADEWKVRLRQGRPDTPFKLSLGRRPDTLLFVAEGDPPYTLATGRAAGVDGIYTEQTWLGDRSIRELADTNGTIASATVGRRFALGGIPHGPAPGPDWQSIALWAVLLIAVLFVGYMATRIIREL